MDTIIMTKYGGTAVCRLDNIMSSKSSAYGVHTARVMQYAAAATPRPCRAYGHGHVLLDPGVLQLLRSHTQCGAFDKGGIGCVGSPRSGGSGARRVVLPREAWMSKPIAFQAASQRGKTARSPRPVWPIGTPFCPIFAPAVVSQ